MSPAMQQPPATAGSRRSLFFILGFAACYAVFHTLYFMIPDDILRERVYHDGIVAISAAIINFIAPGEAVTALANRVQSTRAALEVVRGCDGAGMLFLLWAAVLAFPASLARKAMGLVGAFLIIYMLNQARIVGLYFVVAYREPWFIPLHTFFVPSLLVILGSLFFAWWAFGSSTLSRDPSRAA